MIKLLAIAIEFFLLIHTVDNEKRKRLTRSTTCSNTDIQHTELKDKKDFNYADLSIISLSKVKMPYINCNRSIFCKMGLDFIDLFQGGSINMLNIFKNGSHDIVMRVSYIIMSFEKLLSDKSDYDKDAPVILLDYNGYIEFIEIIRNEFKALNNLLKASKEDKIPKGRVYKHLTNIETYLDIHLKMDSFSLLSRLKPSTLIDEFPNSLYLNIKEIKRIVNKLINNYFSIRRYMGIIWMDVNVPQTCRNYTVFCSYVSRINLLFKWIYEVEKSYVDNTFDNFKKVKYMPLYSINMGYELINKLSSIVEKIFAMKPDEKIDLQEIVKIPSPIFMYDSKNIDCYKFELCNKKKYIIKVFDLENYELLPPGLSTAYLNSNGGFESIGFIGALCYSDNEFIYRFISVEEWTELYISVETYFSSYINNSISKDIFSYHESQALYFILDTLLLLKSLYIYGIRLRRDIVFAVDIRDNKRWQFRIDDIGNFQYIDNGIYTNHKYIFEILEGLLMIIKHSNIRNIL